MTMPAATVPAMLPIVLMFNFSAKAHALSGNAWRRKMTDASVLIEMPS
jgi:hypothetical protein